MYSFKNNFLDKIEKHPLRLNLSVLAILLCLIIAGYSNTFNAEWHLDDYQNIVDNPCLHLKDFHQESLKKTFFSLCSSGQYKGDRIYRPVPCLTFAINWYFGQNNVTGYHITNIFIHLLTAFILFHTILCLLRSPNLKTKYDNAFIIALLSAVLWAVNPVQTQAVTYIVQRMASMAAMFYILGIYLYIRGRTTDQKIYQIIFFIGCCLSFLLALGSKQNAATMPLALLLIETIFFQDISNKKTRKYLLTVSIAGCLLISLFGILFFMKGNPLAFLNGYDYRSFTLSERLMTEARILILYLSQIFYPMPHRLSIEHDLIISKTLFTPWTTLPAIVLIFLLLFIGLTQIKKRPLLSFAVLFFFLNQIIESSIIPLELIFEHRNYLPSMFLFVPVAAGFKLLLDHYKDRRLFSFILGSFIFLVCTGLCSATYIRNMAWETGRSLWEDAIAKAPGKARPAQQLAWYYEKNGNYNKAIKLHKKSLFLEESRREHPKAVTLYNISVNYYNKHDYNNALLFLTKSLALAPGFKKARHFETSVMIDFGKWHEALKSADFLLYKREKNSEYLNMKGFILLKMGQPEDALPYLQEAFKLNPDLKNVALNLGVNLSLLNEYQQADRFLQQANLNEQKDIVTYYSLIENCLRSGNSEAAEFHIKRTLKYFNQEFIIKTLTELPENNSYVPVAINIVAPAIAKKLRSVAEEIKAIAQST